MKQLGKRKAPVVKIQLIPAEALKTKLEELGSTEIKQVARISDKTVKLGGKGKELEGIHRIVYTPSN